MKHGLLCSLAFTCVLLFSCRPQTESLNKTWFFAYYSGSGGSASPNPSLTPENFIDLQKNGSYTSYLSGFDYGTWKKDDKGIQLLNQKGDKKLLKIIFFKEGELVLDLSEILNNKSHHVFTGIPNNQINEANNPFSKQNNQWRIRPSAPENSEQIKKRLVNHFRYWEKYFQWAVDNNLNTVGVGSVNSPIKIYGNGFGLIPYDELPEAWKNNFFDEGDCITAWHKLKTMMDAKNVVWPKTDNRFKFFIAGFQQLQGMVE